MSMQRSDHVGDRQRRSAGMRVVATLVARPWSSKEPSIKATLEAIAWREALALAEDLNIRYLVITSDCRQVIQDINTGTRGGYASIISEINHRATTFHCMFTFESRSVNYEAHNLAKFALSRGLGRHVWFGQSYDQRRIPLRVDFDE